MCAKLAETWHKMFKIFFMSFGIFGKCFVTCSVSYATVGTLLHIYRIGMCYVEVVTCLKLQHKWASKNISWGK